MINAIIIPLTVHVNIFIFRFTLKRVLWLGYCWIFKNLINSFGRSFDISLVLDHASAHNFGLFWSLHSWMVFVGYYFGTVVRLLLLMSLINLNLWFKFHLLILLSLIVFRIFLYAFLNVLRISKRIKLLLKLVASLLMELNFDWFLIELKI